MTRQDHAHVTHARARRVLLLLLAGAGLALSSGRAAAADHEVIFVNRCKEQIWIAEFGSSSIAPHDWALAPSCTQANAVNICASGTCKGGRCTCSSDAECMFGAPAGTTTATCGGDGRCVKKMRIGVPGGWQGRFWPRTGCSGSDTGFVCETGQCGPPTGGNIDCTVQGSTGDRATLFELFAAGNGGTDNFDVSLVSGYNVPVAVKVVHPADAAVWKPSTFFASGAQIVQKIGKSSFAFTNGGSSGTSGATEPAFPDTWTGTVADGSSIVWVNTGPACQTSGCTRRGIRKAACPTALQVSTQAGKYVACDAPANACVAPASCSASLDYFQCQNNGGATDLFGKILTFQSPNAGTFVCFSAEDCPHGTTCELNPTFDTGFQLPAGAGLCTPVAQNGGCTPSDDGDFCPAIDYPFVEYRCQTLSDATSNAQVCVPPTTSGTGNLWWNADNWVEVYPEQVCTQDFQCGGEQKCLTGPFQGGLKQCPPSDNSCTCWTPQTCTATSGTCANPDQCLNVDGVPDGKSDGGKIVDCETETCYCGPQGIYSGTCGPTNPAWLQAAQSISEDGAAWPQGFKDGCPVAYSYQFDDPSSNWSCVNPAVGLNRYKVTFCGSAGR